MDIMGKSIGRFFYCNRCLRDQSNCTDIAVSTALYEIINVLMIRPLFALVDTILRFVICVLVHDLSMVIHADQNGSPCHVLLYPVVAKQSVNYLTPHQSIYANPPLPLPRQRASKMARLPIPFNFHPSRSSSSQTSSSTFPPPRSNFDEHLAPNPRTFARRSRASTGLQRSSAAVGWRAWSFRWRFCLLRTRAGSGVCAA